MSDKPQAKGGIRSTEAQPFGSDGDAQAAQPQANAQGEPLLNPDPQPAIRVGELDPTVTGFDPAFAASAMSDPERVRAIIEALHCHVGVLRGLIARREGEFSTNPSSLEYELQALKKGKLRAEVLLSELDSTFQPK